MSETLEAFASLVGSLAKPGAYFSQMAADRSYKDRLPGVVPPAPMSGLPAWVIPLSIGALVAVAAVAYSSKSKSGARRRKK